MKHKSDKALVLRSTGSWYELLDQDQNLRKGRLKGKLRLKGYKVTNPVSVGDFVEYIEEENAEGNVIIKKILPRENCMIRRSPHRHHFGHIIASNIDLAIVLATVATPKTSTGFIDRFLISAESYGIEAMIVFNKCDLLNQEEKEYLAYLTAVYNNIGYKTLHISALEGDNIDAFTEVIEGKKVLLSGHSGVGKSTLVNSINPNLDLRTQEVSESTGKGMHTTTFSEMHALNQSTYLIDTPGIREFGVKDIKAGELAHYFKEFKEYSGECRFHNCSHTHEPQCEVLRALEEGKIAFSRYDTYVTILKDYDSRG